MSIAVAASLKFAYQDIACVALMLRFNSFSGASFYVEPKDGEDAELRFDRDGAEIIAEIQVKGASGRVTLAEMANCLAHTPERTEKDTLLERLLGDPNRLVVLVMAGRCDDACASYAGRMDWAGAPHKSGHVNATQTAELLDAFAAAVPGAPKGELKAKRKAHNASLAKVVDRSAVRSALSRLIILERLDEAELESFCAEQLRQVQRVPGDQLGDVIRRLLSVVKEAKKEALDAFPLVRAELERATPRSICPLGYVDRGAESDLTNELSTNDVLLLAGTPRVGKTWTARRIAAGFQCEGYEIRELGDLESTERFLLEPTDASRLALLDDPLGGVHPVGEPMRALWRLASLIERLQPNRKLIVAQETSRLLATARADGVGAVSTGRRRWLDLSDLPVSFLVALWSSLADRYAVPDTLRERVLTALSSGSLRLEPGCLAHLAVHHLRLEGASEIDSVARMAREDAADLSRALVQDGFEDLLSALALATTVQEPIDFASLAYVTGAGGDGLPGKRTAVGVMMNFGAPLLPATPTPAYDASPELSNGQLTALEALEQRRLLSISATELIDFNHPFYRSAAECLWDAPTHRCALRMRATVKRALLCLSPRTSRAAARNLHWVFEKLSSRLDARAELLVTATDGLRSYFPATRDICFQFLLRHFDAMSEEQRNALPDWISLVTSVDLHDLQWTDGEAHLAYGESCGIDYFDRITRTVAQEDVATELALLDDPAGGYVSPERATNVLLFLASEPSALTQTIVGRLLSYDEAALRAEAIRLWLLEPRDDDEAVLARIFADDHPSCARSALKGAVAGWAGYTERRREAVLQWLVTLAANAACAGAMLDRLILFNRIEETGKNPPWPILQSILPVVMRVLPLNATINDGRLFDVVRRAATALPPASVVALCDDWIGWIERNAEEGRLPSEFLLSVAEILIAGTRGEPELRAGRVERLLAVQGTGARVLFIADLVDAWDDLLEGEQTAILSRLLSGSADDRWLKAVALARSQTPLVIQQALLGTELSLNDGADALLANMTRDLLAAAIHVYTGRPQPLWWLGTHHRGKQVWEPVVDRIARMPADPLFDLAWDHIYGDGARVAGAIRDLGVAHADRVFDILIRLKVGCTGDFMPEAWAELLSLVADDERHSRFITRMAEHAGAILDDLSDVWLWLTEERDQQAMLDRLETDTLLVHWASMVFEQTNGAEAREVQASFPQLLETLLEQRPMRLYGTCDWLLSALERHEFDTPGLRQSLRSRRDAILQERKRTEIALKRADSPLDGWIT